MGSFSCSIGLKLVRIFVLRKSRMTSNLGDLGSKTRSLGQIKEIPCGYSRGNFFCSIDLKIGQMVCFHETSDEFKFGSPGDQKKKKKKTTKKTRRP